jgi:hypothetical protein
MTMQPMKVSDIDIAFPANVKHLMPPMAEIPEDFKRHRGNPWVDLTSQWFFSGLTGHFRAKDGIDQRMAMRHLKCVIGSFEPKHEHKTAAVAYLMSLWFESYEPGPIAASAAPGAG